MLFLGYRHQHLQLTVTNIIIIVTIIVSLSAFANRKIFDLFKFNAFMIKHSGEVWRFVTSAFIHNDFFHLFVNMYVLYIFGGSYREYVHNTGYVEIAGVEGYFEMTFGSKGIFYFLLMYLMATIISSIYSYETNKNNLWYNAVGASGATSAVVFASIAINPIRSLYMIFLPFPIPGFIMGGLYLFYSWYMGRRKKDNIGHDAHFFGALFGFIFVFMTDFSSFPRFFSAISEYIGQYI